MTDITDITNEIASCVHCGRCTQACDFLKKYALDLSAFAGRSDFAYHCFLCGECSRVCPVAIDGRAIALDMRRAKPNTKGYELLLWEKRNYKFRNYKLVTEKTGTGSSAGSKTVLFPGCNFPSFYPKTTDVLVNIFRENNIGVIYDCCGKPVVELGVTSEVECVRELESRFREHGIDELVMLCPNCYYFLKDKIGIKITDVYTKLRELDLNEKLGEKIKCECDAKIFVPCPDRSTRELEHAIFAGASGEYHEITGVQCCGLGGCAAAKEPELSAGFRERIKSMQLKNIYTYCATCAGSLACHGVKSVKHALVEILNTNETPELTWRSLLNRAKRRFS